MKLSNNFEEIQKKLNVLIIFLQRDKQKQVTASYFVGRRNGKINKQKSFYGF